jgi:hypothetical protein
MHLAQLNIGKLKHPIDDPRVRRFVMALDMVNAVAERMPGFVWRFKDDSGNATAVDAFGDPLLIVNMSVWTDIEALENFVWKTIHRQFFDRRELWFEALDKPMVVFWTIDEGHVPTVEEAKERLDHLNQFGDSDHAFGWSYMPQAKLWLDARQA